MTNWTNKEFSIIEKLTENAVDVITYQIYCDSCDEVLSAAEYASSAAEEAYGEGCRIFNTDDGEVPICRNCIAEKGLEKTSK